LCRLLRVSDSGGGHAPGWSGGYVDGWIEEERVARHDQIVRILTVLRALAGSRRGVSLKALAERHGWHWRNLYRDVGALERAGFPIERTEGGYRLVDGAWSGPAGAAGLDRDEMLALYTVRALATGWQSTDLGRALDRLWNKLSSAGTGQAALLPGGEPWLSVRSPFGINYRAHDKTIATLEKAVRERTAASCQYRAISTGQVTARTIEPGELHWDPALETLYVVGWCRLRRDVRVFAVHRFLMVSLGDEKFAPRAEARSKAALKSAFRVWRSHNVDKVRIRFSPSAAAEIRERKWAAVQRVEEETGGGLVLTMEVAGVTEVERWVLSFGAGAEVLAPRELRDSVAGKLALAWQKYAIRPKSRPQGKGKESDVGAGRRLTSDDNGRG
jgi:predicted DNA-binding transcriptional regulator YafY